MLAFPIEPDDAELIASEIIKAEQLRDPNGVEATKVMCSTIFDWLRVL